MEKREEGKATIIVALPSSRGVWNKALSDFWCNVKFS